MRLKTFACKTAILLLMLLLVAAGRPVAIAETQAQEAEMGQVVADKVNLREGPNTDSDILAEVPGGTAVEVLDKDGTWYRVLYNSIVGYIRQDYLFVNSTGSRGAYVKSDGASLRGGPSTESYVVAQLSAGQGVRVKALIDGEWFYAVVNDQTGYVHRTFLEISASSTASSGMLKQGMEGEEVEKLQNALYDRGFLSKSNISGAFSSENAQGCAGVSAGMWTFCGWHRWPGNVEFDL